MDVRVWSDRHWSFWRCGAGSVGVFRLEWRGICGACRFVPRSWSASVYSSKTYDYLGALQESLSHMYLTYIRPILEYACTAWGNLGTTQVDRLERFQRRAAKIILRRPLFAPSNHDELLATIGWPSLASRRKYFRAVLGHRMATSNVPQHLRDYIPSRPTHMHNTRKPPFFQLPTTNTSLIMA